MGTCGLHGTPVFKGLGRVVALRAGKGSGSFRGNFHRVDLALEQRPRDTTCLGHICPVNQNHIPQIAVRPNLETPEQPIRLLPPGPERALGVSVSV